LQEEESENHELRRAELILAIGTGKDTWWRYTYFEGRTLRRKGRRRISEEPKVEAILVVH
jgi:hypothetical protein